MTRILSSLALMFAVLCLSFLAPVWGGEKDKDKKDKPAAYVSKEHQFQANFPGEPTKKTQNVAGLEQTIYFVERKNGAFFVFHQVNPPVEKGKEKETLSRAKDGIGTVGKVTKSNEIVLDKTYPGIEVFAQIAKPAGAEIIDRIYLVENKLLYQVMVLGEPAFVTSDEAKAFLDSFKYVTEKK